MRIPSITVGGNKPSLRDLHILIQLEPQHVAAGALNKHPIFTFCRNRPVMGGRKGRTNGFMRFADCHRATYEKKHGERLTAQQLTEIAGRDWAQLSPREKEQWKSGDGPILPINETNENASGVTSNRTKQQRGQCGDMKASKEELMSETAFADRFEKSREVLRDQIYQKLLWKCAGANLLMEQFAVLTVFANASSTKSDVFPLEFTVVVLSAPTGQVVAKRFILSYPDSKSIEVDRSRCGFHQMLVDEVQCDEVEFMRQLRHFVKGCWRNCVLVPASMYQTACWSLAWLKARRERAASFPLRHVVCLEDFLIASNRLFGSMCMQPMEDLRRTPGLLDQGPLCPMHASQSRELTKQAQYCYLALTDRACHYLMHISTDIFVNATLCSHNFQPSCFPESNDDDLDETARGEHSANESAWDSFSDFERAIHNEYPQTEIHY